MARQRSILILFLISLLLLLVTVITAFRLRDTDERPRKSIRTNPLLKCDQCSDDEVDNISGEKFHFSASAVREIANKRSYKEVKRAVKEEQRKIIDKGKIGKNDERKKSVLKRSSQHLDEDDDDDDDDEVSSAYVKIAQLRKQKENSDEKKRYTLKNKINHDDDEALNTKNKNERKTINNKLSSTKSQNKGASGKDKYIDEEDSDDDDEDDSDEDDSDEDDSDEDDDNEDDDDSENGNKSEDELEDSESNAEDSQDDDSGDDDDGGKNDTESEDDDDNNDKLEENDDDSDDDDDFDDDNDRDDDNASDDDSNNNSDNTEDSERDSDDDQEEDNESESDDYHEEKNLSNNESENDSENSEKDTDDDESDEDSDNDAIVSSSRTKSSQSPNSKLIKEAAKLKTDVKQGNFANKIQKSSVPPSPKSNVIDYLKKSAKKENYVAIPKENNQAKIDKKKLMVVVSDRKKDLDQKLVKIEKSGKVPEKKEKKDSIPPTKETTEKAPKIAKSDKSEAKQSKPSGKVILQTPEPKKKESESKNKPGDFSDVLKKIHGDESKRLEKPSKEKTAHGALHRKNLDLSEFEDFYAFLPTFAPNFTRIQNAECRHQGQILLRQLRGSKIWALNMLDATGKISSGILQGNGNQLGNFDQCIGSRARVRLDSGSIVKIHGKYCLAQVDLKAVDEELKLPVHLAQARNLIRSKIGDPGHFIPRFSSLNWGLCIPATCDAEDAEFILRDAVKHYNGASGIRIAIDVDPNNCHSDEGGDWWDDWVDIPTILTLSLYLALISVVLYATAKDYALRRKGENNEIQEDNEEKPSGEASDENVEDTEKETLSSDKEKKTLLGEFSLYSTTEKLFRDAADDGDITCIHGVRALCSLALLIAHKVIPLAMTPYTNRIQLTEFSNNPLSLILRNSLIYTDSFLLLSGTLSAYHLAKDFCETGSVPWTKRYFYRYIRLTPALAATVLWYAYIWDKISWGPQWGTLITKNAELCQEGLWSNLLYVQNFFNFEQMCAPHTHQLALDMQLTLLAGGAVWMAWNKPWPALGLGFLLHILAIYLRYSTALEHRLSMIIYHGASSRQLYRTATMSYARATHRITPYLAGLTLGIVLSKLRESPQIPKWLLAIGWTVSTASTSWLIYAGWDASDPQFEYSASSAATIAAFVSPAASFVLCWIVFVCFSGYAEFLNRFLSTRFLVFFSRISYAMYLCQFIVFFTNVATVRSATALDILNLIDVKEMVIIIIVSTLLTLCLVIPIQSLPKYMLANETSEMTTEDGNNEADGSQKEEDHKDNSICEDDDGITIKDIINHKTHNTNEKYNQIIDPKVLLAHRDMLEEILEAELEMEYEDERLRREEGLEEILEEEEDDIDLIDRTDIDEQLEEDMEIIEGENLGDEEDEGVVEEAVEEEEEGSGGAEEVNDFWRDREEDDASPMRRYSATWSVDENEDPDEDYSPREGNSWARYRYSR